MISNDTRRKLARRWIKDMRIRNPFIRRRYDAFESMRQRLFRKRLNKKIYNGSIFDRLHGLDYLLERCEECSILDIGSADGLIDYEFARHGARLIHGFDRQGEGCDFSRRLFKDVPLESVFTRTNLAINWETFRQTYANVLRERYDIVLYLGVYQHVKRHCPPAELADFIRKMAGLTEKWFAVRTDLAEEIETLLANTGLEVIQRVKSEKIGLLHIYERKSGRF